MYVIAGATGHVGSVVAKELLGKKEKVKVLVRSQDKGRDWLNRGAELAVGSLDDRAFLTSALRGADGFFAMMPPPPFTTEDFYAAQRKMADTIVGAVKDSGVPHVVMLSSVGADLSSGNGPIRGLNYLENALRATGTTLTAIRAGYFQENVAHVLGAARGAGIYPNFTSSADMAVPMIATKDIGALAARALLEKPSKGEVIDLQGPAYSATQIAEKLGAALGKPVRVVTVPQPGWIEAMIGAGFPRPFAEVYSDMYGGVNSGRIRPAGDRVVEGKTAIDDVIGALVR